jgi:hypothetical protein
LIPIGLYIAAYIKDTVDSQILLNGNENSRYNPSTTRPYRHHVMPLNIIRVFVLQRLLRNSIPTVVGGYHPTNVPDLMLFHPQIGMVIRGSEATMKELVGMDNFRMLGLYKKMENNS